MARVSFVSYCIVVNGFPSKPFPAQKGLRQGDPMSPFLFALCMECLSRCLVEMTQDPNFNFHPRCEKLGITHMMFADDRLLFARADPISIQLFLGAIQKFSSASGLSANLSKSEVYFGGISEIDQDNLRNILGMSKGSLHFRYLGVPLSSKKLTIAQSRPLIERVTARIDS
ncbi:uncharacterized protein LOC110740209 [Chenopodium quinoa]|uniref:uncharacterized protein LOC110740209 n=1 Tax=Chenopodium quinoa TaxID=63459 RepID=UPI000B7721AC|nr:uncharacterized protein LOC110740209 [Chenopodium quinoa]